MFAMTNLYIHPLTFWAQFNFNRVLSWCSNDVSVKERHVI